MTDDRITAEWLEGLGAKFTDHWFSFHGGNVYGNELGDGYWQTGFCVGRDYIKVKTNSQARLLAVARALGVELQPK